MEKESLSVQMNPFSGEVCARASLFLSYSDFMASFLAIAKKDIRKNENYKVPFKRIDDGIRLHTAKANSFTFFV